MDRFEVKPNGAGGYQVYDRRDKKVITECSQWRNADIVRSRLMGWRDSHYPDWFGFYRARP